MFSPRWRKLLRDLRAAKGRMVMMVIAIAVGIFGVGTILSAYTILTREISRNYLSTNPASAFLEMDKVDDSFVDSVRHRPGIADVEASSTVMARIETKPGEWMPLLLFVVKDFNGMRINTFQPESGAWPPPEGSILMERVALPLVNAKVGDDLKFKPPMVQSVKSPFPGSSTIRVWLLPGRSRQRMDMSLQLRWPGLAKAVLYIFLRSP